MTREELKKLAEAATPGPWTSDGADVQDRHRTVARIWGEAADAAFIAAANPAAVLALLAEVEAMERVCAAASEWNDAEHDEVAGLHPTSAPAIKARQRTTIAINGLRDVLDALRAARSKL